MSTSLRAVAGDYRRRPTAALAVLSTLLVPTFFVAGSAFVAGLGQLLIPFGLLALALVAQVGRLASAPATAVGEALLAGESPRDAVGIARGRAADRIVAATVERALVVVGTTVFGTALLIAALAAATAGGYALSVAGVVAPQESFTVLLLAVFGLLGIGAAVAAPLRLGTSLAGDVPAVRSPGAAVSLTRTFPGAVARLVALRTAPWATFVLAVVVGLVGSADPPLPTALLGATIVVAAVATPLAVGLERRVVASAPPPVDPPAVTSIVPDRRVLLAGVVVLAAVAAPTMAVRVADERPTTGSATPVSTDASAESVVASATDATRRTNHYENATSWAYNDTTGSMERALAFDRGWDPADRQAILVPEPHVAETLPGMGPIFYGDGTVAFGYETSLSGWVVGLIGYDAGRWTVLAVPGGGAGTMDGGGLGDRLSDVGIDDGAIPWRVLSRESGTIAVGVERPERLARAFGVESDAVAADSHVRLSVDAETGRPRTLSVNYNVTEEGDRRHLRTVVHYGEWETYDLRRPEPIHSPTAPELFWDALGY